MSTNHYTYGIWGFGVVGQSVLNHLTRTIGKPIAVYDARSLTPEEQKTIKAHHGVVYQPDMLETFLHSCERIVPSPGITLHKYTSHTKKWLSELDLFAHAWHKPVIAITGTVGKTTTAALLAHTLQHAGMQIGLGGNIGTPMLNLVEHQDKYDYAILELSSFQLMHAQTFAPTIGVLLNLYPNHLDYHASYDEYRDAKLKLFTQQTSHQYALVPTHMKDAFKQNRVRVVTVTPYGEVVEKNGGTGFTGEEGWVLKCELEHKRSIIRLGGLPQVTVTHNLIYIAAVLDVLGIDQRHLATAIKTFERQVHRMELVLEYNGITFYNDSKSTLPEATLAAIQRLGNRPTILMLGGLSKGIDRSYLFKQLPSSIRHVVCFGAEAQQLSNMAQKYNVSCSTSSALEEALSEAYAFTQPGDALVFSPGGSSFDLFTDYKDRGDCFKALVVRQWGPSGG